MPSPGVQVEKSGAAIQEMFSRVAPRYDLLNRLLSGSLDVLWRRRAAAALQLGPGSRVLDLCSGTGDQALAIRRRHRARIAAADFCLPMLALARRKFSLTGDPRPANLASDALAIPFADASFDAGTVSFGLRNVADLDRALSEICRVLKPRGQAVFLEFALPRSRVFKAIYLFYFRRILMPADNEVFNVPMEFQEAIVQRAIYHFISKVRNFREARDAGLSASGHHQQMIENYRDWADS